MFTSLKVVSIAVSLFTATKRSATFLRSIDIFLRVVPLVPSSGIVPIDGTAFTASSLVILPAFPVPLIVDASISFSAKIFLAAGDAVPDQERGRAGGVQGAEAAAAARHLRRGAAGDGQGQDPAGGARGRAVEAGTVGVAGGVVVARASKGEGRERERDW